MRWWLRARRAHPYLTAGFGLFVVLILLCRDYLASLPSLTPTGGQVLLMLFAPLPVCVGVFMCLNSGLKHAERTGIRPVPLMDNGLVVSVALAATAIGSIFGQLLNSPAAHAVGRNTVFLIGLMLLARPLMGPAAVLVPPGWVIVVTLLGYTPAHTPRLWSVLPYPGDDSFMLAAAWLVLAAGMAGMHLEHSRLRLR